MNRKIKVQRSIKYIKKIYDQQTGTKLKSLGTKVVFFFFKKKKIKEQIGYVLFDILNWVYVEWGKD